MKQLHIILGLTLIILMVLAGCSEEDCPICPDRAGITKATLTGYVTLFGEFMYFNATLQGIDALLPAVDSVLFCDTACSLIAEFNPYRGHYYWVTGRDFSDQDQYSSGDTVTINVFMPAGNSTFQAKLLDYIEDSIHVHNWQSLPNDSNYVDTATELIIQWDTIPNADWFLVSIYSSYWDDSAGYRSTTRDFVVPESCQITIPAGQTRYNGYWYFDIFALTGPEFPAYGDADLSEVCDGLVSGYTARTLVFLVGTGIPYPPGSQPVDPDSQYRPLSPMEILYQFQAQ